MSDSELREMIVQYKYLEKEMNRLKQKISKSSNDLVETFKADLDKIYEFKGKDHGQVTLERDGVSLSFDRPRTVKYDNDAITKAISLSNLTWDQLNDYFTVKFDLNQTGYKKLSEVAEKDEKISDLLSMIDDAKTIEVKPTKLKTINIKDD